MNVNSIGWVAHWGPSEDSTIYSWYFLNPNSRFHSLPRGWHAWQEGFQTLSKTEKRKSFGFTYLLGHFNEKNLSQTLLDYKEKKMQHLNQALMPLHLLPFPLVLQFSCMSLITQLLSFHGHSCPTPFLLHMFWLHWCWAISAWRTSYDSLYFSSYCIASYLLIQITVNTCYNTTNSHINVSHFYSMWMQVLSFMSELNLTWGTSSTANPKGTHNAPHLLKQEPKEAEVFPKATNQI